MGAFLLSIHVNLFWARHKFSFSHCANKHILSAANERMNEPKKLESKQF